MRDYQNAWMRAKGKDPVWAAHRNTSRRLQRARRKAGIAAGRILRYQAFDISKELTICVSTWNRPAITRLCLERLYQTKASAHLIILDDGSDCDTSHFDLLADQVIRQPHGEGGSQGVAQNRIRLTEEALKNKRQFVYHTDSDIMHDLDWIPCFGFMTRMYEDYLVYSLMNSSVQAGRGMHGGTPQEVRAGVERRVEVPGASMLVRSEALEKYGSPFGISREQVARNGAWDHGISINIAEYRTLVSLTSYADHFRQPGDLHEGSVDESLNLTLGLKIERPDTLARLKILSQTGSQ